MPNKVKLLVVGDIIGKGARNAFTLFLPKLKEKYNYDIIAVNAENTTHGRGLNYKHYCLYNNLKIDVLTMGNHVLDNKEIFDYIENTNNLVVPGNVNYEVQELNNHKETVIDFNGYKIRFINLLSIINNKANLDITDPLEYFDSIYKDDGSIYVIDYHSELTMQKNILGYYVDGRASLVYGTHTHVQTADERILPNKTAYISDVGMCGSIDSVIGYDYKSFIDRKKNNSSTFVAKNAPYMINALYVEIDLDSKQATYIERINQKM